LLTKRSGANHWLGRICLVAEAVFLCGEKHAIGNLVALLSTVMQQVPLSTVRINALTV